MDNEFDNRVLPTDALLNTFQFLCFYKLLLAGIICRKLEFEFKFTNSNLLKKYSILPFQKENWSSVIVLFMILPWKFKSYFSYVSNITDSAMIRIDTTAFLIVKGDVQILKILSDDHLSHGFSLTDKKLKDSF